MKHGLFILLALSLRLAVGPSANAATTTGVTTPTVPSSITPAVLASEVAGFTTIHIAPAQTQPEKAQLSLDGVGLVNHIAYEGTTKKAQGRTLFDSAATWSDNQFNPTPGTKSPPSHYLEITSGPAAGLMVDIVATHAKHQTLTLAAPLPANIGKNADYCVRPHWTLAGLFGTTNEAGLQTGDANDADLISIYAGKAYDHYYFSTVSQGTNSQDSAIGSGWRRIGGGSVDQANTPIYPDDGLVITRMVDTPLDIMVAGVVKLDRAMIPIRRGLNVVANVYQAPITLAASRLYTGHPGNGLRAGGNADSADQVQIYNGTGYDTYYYQMSGRNGSGWRSATDAKTDAGNTALAVGSAFIVRRDGPAFNWIPPVPVP